MALSVGSLLAGRYEIVAPVATGGMGEVWRARDRVLDRIVAAKVLRSEYTGDPSFLARFRNEARHTAALSHPNIASVYDYGEIEQGGQTLAFLVMEFVEGSPLGVVLHEHGRLSVQQTLDVLRQSAEGLSAAHSVGMVHRDIKPGNLMVRPDGVVKLTDFGIARARDATPLTRTGMVVGTAQYLSPEQAQGMDVTAASDVYSLGIVGYECLAGGRPFDGASQVAIALMQINRPPPPLPADVPPPVRQLIERALAKDPAARFTDGGDFAAAVRTVAAGGALADPTGATTVLPPSDGRGTRVLPAAAAGAALGAAARGPRTGTGTSPGTAAATAGFGRPVPPLQGPPVDGEDDDRLPGAPEDDEPRRRPAWAWPVAAVAVLALLGVAAFLLLSRGSDSPADTATAPTTSASASAPASTSASAPTSAATVLVDTASYVGVPADQVQRQLQGRGLQVDTEDATAAQLAAAGTALQAGDVVTTDPAGRPVPVGSSVTLFVARDAFSPGGATRTTAGSTGGDTGGGSGGSGNDGGQVTTAPRTTTATTQPRTTAPTSSTAPSTASSAPAGSSVGGGGAGPSGGTEGGSDGNGQQGGRSATTSPVVTDNSLTRATPGAGRTTAASAGRTG